MENVPVNSRGDYGKWEIKDNPMGSNLITSDNDSSTDNYVFTEKVTCDKQKSNIDTKGVTVKVERRNGTDDEGENTEVVLSSIIKHEEFMIKDEEPSQQTHIEADQCWQFENAGMEKCTTEKLLKCYLCSYRCERKSKLTQHMKTHTPDIWKSAFTMKSDFIYLGEMPFKCSVCEKGFLREHHLIKHMIIHPGKKPFKCTVCEKAFTTNCNLVKHMMIHTGEKPFTCKDCERAFTRKSSLVSHMLIHTGEKPFNCNVCKKAFTMKVNLVQHINAHMGKQPFKCKDCEKALTVKCNLVKHMIIHTGEKLFKCKICEKAFIRKASLVKHIKKHTG